MKRPKCVQEFDVAFGRRLIRHLGGDPALIEEEWCWPEFAKAYPHLREKAERYFETTRTGDPAQAACRERRLGTRRARLITWPAIAAAVGNGPRE